MSEKQKQVTDPVTESYETQIKALTDLDHQCANMMAHLQTDVSNEYSQEFLKIVMKTQYLCMVHKIKLTNKLNSYEKKKSQRETL